MNKTKLQEWHALFILADYLSYLCHQSHARGDSTKKPDEYAKLFNQYEETVKERDDTYKLIFPSIPSPPPHDHTS